MKHKYYSAINRKTGEHYILEQMTGQNLPSPRLKKTNVAHMETWERDRPSPDPAKWTDILSLYKDLHTDALPTTTPDVVRVTTEEAAKNGLYFYPVYFKCIPGQPDEYTTEWTGSEQTGSCCGIMLASFADLKAKGVTDPEAAFKKELEEYANWFHGRACYYNLYQDGRYIARGKVMYSNAELAECEKWDYLGEFENLEACYEQCQERLHLKLTPQRPLWERLEHVDDYYEKAAKKWAPQAEKSEKPKAVEKEEQEH